MLKGIILNINLHSHEFLDDHPATVIFLALNVSLCGVFVCYLGDGMCGCLMNMIVDAVRARDDLNKK